ncbi:ATP-binding protein [Hahella sp. NBU794]|uniref:HAMP domain-containing sensor histidine kinase n=1 Tax=Hahella sp. NBU794 TaxID=3422590 RepID=UPI003D6E601A
MFKRLQPQAVWQLVLISLMTVVAPLGLLLYHTTVSLQTLALDSRAVTEDSVAMAQNGRNAKASLIDMERVARQYMVIGDKALVDLFKSASEQFLAPLTEIAQLLGTPEAQALLAEVKEQQRDLQTKLEKEKPNSPALTKEMAEFSSLQRSADRLILQARTFSEDKLHELGRAAAQARENVIQSSLVLAPVTLALIVLFTYLIVRPVRQLKTAIRTLSIGRQKPIELFGPQELVQLAEELNSLQERLSQVEDQKQQFLRHVSHELKTPLASIREGVALLQEEVVGQISHGQREVLHLVNENGRALQQLIENLLSFNRLNFSGQAQKMTFDMSALVEELLHLHWLSLTHKRQIICVGGPPLTLTAERPRLHSALDNLISNAIAYGASEGRIWLEWNIEDDHLILRVTNTGAPIPEAERSRIFEPFYQGSVKRSGAVKGSGIGLSVARDCIQTQGGELKLLTTTGQLVSFAIYLPRTVVSAI